MRKEVLIRLGLKPQEIKVYSAAIEHPRSTPAQIANYTKINRTTVYSIAKGLAGKGLLVEDLGGKTLHLIPTSPNDLKYIIKKEETDLREKAKAVEELMHALSAATIEIEHPVPKIRFVEESDILEHIRTRSTTWNESALQTDNVWWGFQDHTFVEHYRELIDWVWKRTPKKVFLKLLSNDSPIEKRMAGRYPRRHIKFWKKVEQFSATTWIVGEYLVMIRTDHKPFYLVEIHDAALAENMRKVFTGLWELV